MAFDILPSAQQYLDENDTIDIATLVSIELPGGNGSFLNLTDYKRKLIYKSVPYETGRLKRATGVTRTTDLAANPVSITVTGADQTEVDRAINSASYLEKKIRVWRAVIKPDGTILDMYGDNTTMLMFEGNISEVSIKENATVNEALGTSEITWKCASEFYELDRVNGRLTDDDSHRGIIVDSDGNEIPSNAAKKPEYQDDLGFFHSNQSIDVLATYQTEEQRTMMKKKSSGLFGLQTDYDMVTYYETVTKEVDIRFNLAAKYIPVVYGVQKVQGIPVFADTLADDPSKVYVVYAFCEGEIEGYLDFFLNDQPMVCYNDQDVNDRVCFGTKQTLGDTIASVAVAGGEGTNGCTIHGTEYVYDDGNGAVSVWAYHGKNDQTSSSLLSSLAAQNAFLIQEGSGSTYWDENFKLTDTAYVVMEVNITDTRTDVPTLHAEIRGKKVSVYDDEASADTSETSLNAAWQILDYLRSPIYGVGVSLDRIDLDSFFTVAEIFEALDEEYSADWVSYWRYVGWNNRDASNRTVMQTNVTLDTNNTLFKNMDTMLKQVMCSLNIINGRYTLTVESAGKTPIVIPEEHIMGGSLSLSDVTSKNKFNTVTAAIDDPGVAWQTNTIVFFEGDYLAEDNNVEKKMNLAFPHITNYYTARSLAERELRKSRYSREVEIVLPFKYVDLPINQPVLLSKQRFGWVDKEFLLRKVAFIENGKARVTLREYSEGVFINSPQSDKTDDNVPPIVNLVKPPREVEYVPTPTDISAQIGENGKVRWLPSLSPDVTYYTVRVSGDLEPITVAVDTLDPNAQYIHASLAGYEAGNYTIEVRAVSSSRGLSSTPVTIVVDMDPAKNLPVVQNFRLQNPALGEQFTWVGPEPIFIWDRISDEYLGDGGDSYLIEILDASNDALLNQYTTAGTTLPYPFATNKADYAGAGYGVGVFRNIKARIVAIGDSGERSVDWANL
ncbi:central tail fiber J [Vibrio phage D260]